MTLNINITISHQWPEGQPGWATKEDLKETESHIMASQQETLEQLQSIADQAVKILGESQKTRAAVDALTARVAELEALIANGSIPESVTAKIAEVKAALQVVDDVVPD